MGFPQSRTGARDQPSASRASTRVFVADADPRFRAALVERLGAEDGLLPVGEASDLDSLLSRVASSRPDVLLIDERLPGDDPDIAFDRIRRALPRLRVVVLTDLATLDDPLATLLPTDAAGLLDRRLTPDQLVVAIRTAASGEIAVSRGAIPKLLAQVRLLDRALRQDSARVQLALESLEAQLRELQDTYHATVEALAAAVELRDEYTGGHIVRVRDYSVAIARAVDQRLAGEPFVFGYLLHDVGKLAIPDAVLLKPGPLTAAEFEAIKEHSVAGARYVEAIPFLLEIRHLVRHHHERWDGAGYPDGLRGDQIPPEARIFALADALDAITTDRPYRRARPLEYALEQLRAGAGGQFDPAMVKVFEDLVLTDPAFDGLRAGLVPGRTSRA